VVQFRPDADASLSGLLPSCAKSRTLGDTCINVAWYPGASLVPLRGWNASRILPRTRHGHARAPASLAGHSALTGGVGVEASAIGRQLPGSISTETIRTIAARVMRRRHVVDGLIDHASRRVAAPPVRAHLSAAPCRAMVTTQEPAGHAAAG